MPRKDESHNKGRTTIEDRDDDDFQAVRNSGTGNAVFRTPMTKGARKDFSGVQPPPVKVRNFTLVLSSLLRHE